MKKYSLLLLCLTVTLFAMSQKPVISFEKTAHDFGKVNESDGKITNVFDFKNVGNSPLVINRVQASCGCTTPTWTKEPIEPGKKGSITVTYNPQGRPGAFTKTITVYSNAVEEQMILTIRGEVLSAPTADNSPFPITVGGLGIKSKVVQMNNVEKGKSQTRVLEFHNGTNLLVKPTIENLPTYVTAVVTPEQIKPNEDGTITFVLNSKLCPQWGMVSDDVYLNTSSQKKISDENKIMVVANVIEDFSKMTLEQKRKAPILEVTNRTLEMGTIMPGARRFGKIKINNKGQNNLEIRRIINLNKELVVRSSKMSIPGGKSTEMMIDLNSKNLNEGDYKKSFTIQTNDPDNSFIILVVSWKVKK